MHCNHTSKHLHLRCELQSHNSSQKISNMDNLQYRQHRLRDDHNYSRGPKHTNMCVCTYLLHAVLFILLWFNAATLYYVCFCGSANTAYWPEERCRERSRGPYLLNKQHTVNQMENWRMVIFMWSWTLISTVATLKSQGKPEIRYASIWASVHVQTYLFSGTNNICAVVS